MLNQIKEVRTQLEMELECALAETEEFGKAAIKAIGDISVDEYKEAIINQFRENISVQRYHGTFNRK